MPSHPSRHFLLLDLDRALRQSLALGQRYLEHAILQLGLAVGRVGVGWQLEAAVDLDVGVEVLRGSGDR